METRGLRSRDAGLIGSRIRVRRLDLGLRQADVARAAGISPSYLNLIEHNRRSIGGRLLNVIAAALEVEPGALAEGAEAALLAGLREAAATPAGAGAEAARAEEFAGRFPGWAATVAGQSRRIAALERRVEALGDRLTHDPFLASALHDVLSTVTAIRATSAILADGGALEPEWQARFQRNIHEESARLAGTSQKLAAYLERTSGEEPEGSPLDEIEAWLAREGWSLPGLEGGAEAAALIPPGLSPAAAALALRWLRRAAEDAQRLPLARLAPAVATLGVEPERLAWTLGAEPALVLRRLAMLPEATAGRLGVLVADAGGGILFRRSLAEFPLVRRGAGCPLWPIWEALARPGEPVRRLIASVGRDAAPCRAWAIADRAAPAGFGHPAVVEAVMLLRPAGAAGPGAAGPAAEPVPVGPACRVCSRIACPARREPSLLADGF